MLIWRGHQPYPLFGLPVRRKDLLMRASFTQSKSISISCFFWLFSAADIVSESRSFASEQMRWVARAIASSSIKSSREAGLERNKLNASMSSRDGPLINPRPYGTKALQSNPHRCGKATLAA